MPLEGLKTRHVQVYSGKTNNPKNRYEKFMPTETRPSIDRASLNPSRDRSVTLVRDIHFFLAISKS